MGNPYSPRIGGDAIRLFRIDSSSDGAISVELRRFALKGRSRYPPFVATSYVWGPPTYTSGATINGQPKPILQSALGFLRAMLSDRWRKTLPPSKTWWWMDSICINQQDDRERSAQVQLMSTIYTHARMTVIWLGEESEDSDRAVNFLSTLSNVSHRDPLDSGIAEDAKSWAAVANLLRREWFERGWTLQEFLLSRHASFFCGSKQINHHRMFDAVGIVWDYHQWKQDIIPRESYEKAWNRFRMMERYSHELTLPLVGTLAYTATSRVTDPRDRLYSLLGLAGPIDREIVGQPDYKSDPELVFTKFAKSFVEKHESLDIVCLAAVQRGVAEEEDLDKALDLPSWVPDWSIQLLHSGPVPCMASQSARTHVGNFRPMHSIDFSAIYAAFGGMGPDVRFSDNLREMICGGILLDRVDGLAGVKQVRKAPVDLVQSTSAANVGSPDASARSQPTPKGIGDLIWRQVPRCLVLDRKDRYLRHPAPILDFSSQFRSLCQAIVTKGKETLPIPFKEWFQLTKDLAIRGVTLQEATRTLGNSQSAFDLQEMTGALHDIPGMDDWESFVSRLRDTSCTMGMRLMVTDTGLVGMAPREAKKGDIVCVLFGCSIPLVLRQVPDSDRESFKVVGECFMAGFMNGEIWETMLPRHAFRLV
ncbi:heterokaryon incompatibility protein-domain-containing protein [Immersiella caudata]|uniref:Heterokaryon incompatibility protein-domain-containing protein n=1 Tax=Immersiella caudata TaxID=314043 RepID=A0AA40CBJ5_9PEZI|nr:heterokaryon incompatibility protein-domain-containing protein [Immersiella caudata]